MFRDTILDAIHKYVPMKTSKKKENLPYMTAEISKLIKKRDRVFKKRAKAGKNFEQSRVRYQNIDRKMRDLKSTIQKKLRASYWTYIEKIITPMDVDNEQTSEYQGLKRFLSFIKSRRKDNRKS